MKLIADAGSTKIEWVVIDPVTHEATSFTAQGLNPLLTAPDSLEAELRTRVAGLKHLLPSVTECHYYGAGCIADIIPHVTSALKAATGCSEVTVDSDLLGSARALFPDGCGIACILGTGSNSCIIDSGRITDHIPPLGFILGDEGSGATLGKRFIADMLKRRLPAGLWNEWCANTGLDYAATVHRIYRSPAPNTFLAAQTYFIAEHLDQPEIEQMVREELQLFLRRNVLPYHGSESLPLRFTGSIADVFAPQLREAAASCGLAIDCIISKPINGLIQYHIIH